MYLSEASVKLMEIVAGFNEIMQTKNDQTKSGTPDTTYYAGYSFNAGQNGLVFVDNEHLNDWMEYSRGILIEAADIIHSKMGKGTHLIKTVE